ncbi:MAG: GntR family transcriptional regulator [Synergistaceae bacterium]|nr:GntR family transcriptional regulator [Synergistaceae bacterium]
MSFFQNESLRKQLYDYIKQKINAGELKRGDMINQKELSEELGISRTPFRDCMIQLESEGLVTIIPCKGVIVRYLTFEEIMEVQEIGAALEGMAYELAFGTARKYCIDKLTAIVSDVQTRLEKGDVSLCYEKNQEFHTLILDRCPNKQIVTTLVKMRERLYDFPRHDLAPVLKWEKIFWQEHLNQIKILREGTAKEFGEYDRNVHWGIKGKEGYWETLFNVPAGSVNKYFHERSIDS